MSICSNIYYYFPYALTSITHEIEYMVFWVYIYVGMLRTKRTEIRFFDFPTFPHTLTQTYIVYGWHRCFCLLSIDFFFGFLLIVQKSYAVHELTLADIYVHKDFTDLFLLTFLIAIRCIPAEASYSFSADDWKMEITVELTVIFFSSSLWN